MASGKQYPQLVKADAPRFVQMASALVQSEDLEAAEGAAELATIADPQHADAWLTLGIVRARRNEYTRAIPDYIRALELRPDDVSSWCDLGELYTLMGDYQKAAAALRQAMVLDPNADHPAGRRARAIVGRSLARLAKEK